MEVGWVFFGYLVFSPLILLSSIIYCWITYILAKRVPENKGTGLFFPIFSILLTQHAGSVLLIFSILLASAADILNNLILPALLTFSIALGILASLFRTKLVLLFITFMLFMVAYIAPLYPMIEKF